MIFQLLALSQSKHSNPVSGALGHPEPLPLPSSPSPYSP